MIIKTYQQYLIKSLLKNIFLISFIFLILSFVLNILEEIKFLKNLISSTILSKKAKIRKMKLIKNIFFNKDFIRYR